MNETAEETKDPTPESAPAEENLEARVRALEDFKLQAESRLAKLESRLSETLDLISRVQDVVRRTQDLVSGGAKEDERTKDRDLLKRLEGYT